MLRVCKRNHTSRVWISCRDQTVLTSGVYMRSIGVGYVSDQKFNCRCGDGLYTEPRYILLHFI